MLVCSLVIQRPRAAIAADIAEASPAFDTSTVGNIVFAALVDDPASVLDTVDAYLGEIMLEAASASDALDADIGGVISATVVEGLTAADTPDGTVSSGTATWDPATVTAVTLSGGNLIATSTGTTSLDQGARVAAANGKTSGKYYFEVTITAIVGGGVSVGTGVCATTQTYTQLGTNAAGGIDTYRSNGNIWVNGSAAGVSLGIIPVGTPIGIAVDLDNRKIWLRKTPSGNWNNSGTADPASNTGGLTVPAGTIVPFCSFGGTGGAVGEKYTGNFGASAFSGAVPSGFISGWPL